MWKKTKEKGKIVLAFAAGVFLAEFCPASLILFMLAVVLVIMGFSYLKECK